MHLTHDALEQRADEAMAIREALTLIEGVLTNTTVASVIENDLSLGPQWILRAKWLVADREAASCI